MPTKRGESHATQRNKPAEPLSLPNDFPAELLGEFADIPGQFWTNFGTICGLALASGGYVGISITDDRGSAKLAIRCPYVSFEKRVYKLADLERLSTYVLGKTKA